MNPFERALVALDEHGWHQGGLTGFDGICLVGAMYLALYGEPIPQGNHLADENPWPVLFHVLNGQHPAGFNDDPATSEEDVRLLLKHAAAEWETRKGSQTS